MKSTPPLEPHFSLYLDLVRFSAACLVVISHYLGHGIVSIKAASFLPDLGREAVITFFVLSGFVIAYSTEQKQPSAKDYLIARCTRIYSAALPILLLAFFSVFLATCLFDSTIANYYQLDKAYLYIPFHLLFLGETWNFSETPPWLGQYWSLGYEVWYYAIFAAVYFLRGYKRVFLAGGILLFVGHKLWLLLPVWLSGVYLYHLQKNIRNIPFKLARVGWFGTLMLLAAYKFLGMETFLRAFGNEIWPFPSLRLGSADRYIADYLICLLICLNFILAKYANFSFLNFGANWIKRFASYTFTLYLVHIMVMEGWLILHGHDSSKFYDTAALTILIGIVTYIAGMLTEKRKWWFQRMFEFLFKSTARTQVEEIRSLPGR